MKLQKLRYILIGLGFFWIFVSTVLGSLIGVRITFLTSQQSAEAWMQSMEKIMLVSSHSHLNLMAMVMVLMGVTLKFIWDIRFIKILNAAVWANIVSIPIFILGILARAFTTNSLFFTGLTAFGAIFYIISVGIYGSFFLYKFFKSS